MAMLLAELLSLIAGYILLPEDNCGWEQPVDNLSSDFGFALFSALP